MKQKGIKLPPEGGQSMQEGKHVHCGELNPCRCVAAGSGRPPWHCAHQPYLYILQQCTLVYV